MRVDASGISGLFYNNVSRLNNRDAKTVLERLSSGLRINRGADDPSGLGISQGMRAVIGGLDQAIGNAQDGYKMLSTMDSSLNEMQDMVLRGYELAVRAANFAVNTDEDLQRFQNEVDAIVDQIDQSAYTAKYNTLELLTGGTGRDYDITTQADWAAGTTTVGAVDTWTNPDSMRLDLIDPTTIAAKSTPTGDQARRMVNPYVTGYVDNMDGTVNMTLRIRARSQAGVTDFDGTIGFDASAVLVALNANVNGADNVVVWNAGTQTLDFNAGGNRIRTNTTWQDEVEITVQLAKDPAAMRVDLELVGPSGNPPTQMYFGTTLLVDGLGRYTTDAYMTDIEPTATWQSAAIDTGNTTGGDATLTWNSTTPPGTQVAVQIYESAAAGGPWTPLAVVENGGSFEYTKNYLMAEVIMATPSIEFGTPEIQDIQIKTKQGTVLQIGENNQGDHRLFVDAYDARSTALGLQGVDVTVAQKIIKQYDSQAEWAAGIVSNPGGLIDYLAPAGEAKLNAPISTQPPAQAQAGGQNMYIRIDTSNYNVGTGLYDTQMSMSVYGVGPTPNGAQAQGWVGLIRMYDGAGNQLQVSDVNNISQESPGGVPVYVPGVGIGPGYANTADANFLDTDNNGTADTYVGNIANGNTYGGGAGWGIYFDMGTTTAQDGVDFNVSVPSDAYIRIDFDAVGFSAAHTTVTDEQANVYFHDELIATNFDNSPATQTIIYRLQEYGTQPPGYVPPAVPTGTFTTGSTYFGANQKGFLNVTESLNGGATTYTVEESATGTGGWSALAIDPTDNSFTTSGAGKYIHIIGQLDGTGPNLVVNPHAYTMSTSPVVDSIIVTSEANAIYDFQEANRRISAMRAEIGIAMKRLEYIIEDLSVEKLNLIHARSRITDADMALEAVEKARTDILNESITAVRAQGDPFMRAILDLESSHNIGAQGIQGTGVGIIEA